MVSAQEKSIADRLRNFTGRLISLELCIYGLAERLTPATVENIAETESHYLKTINEILSDENATTAAKYHLDGHWEVERRIAKPDLEPHFFEEMGNLSEYFAAGYLELCRNSQNVSPAMYKGQEGSSHSFARGLWCYGKSMFLRVFLGLGESMSKDNGATLVDTTKRFRAEASQKWRDEVGSRPEGGIAILQMEMVQSIMVAPRIPPASVKLPITAFGAFEMTNRIVPRCEKCGGSMIASRTKGKIQYRKCDRCGATGKRIKPS